MENQVGTFLGQDQAVRPPSSLEWAQGMAEALYLLHHHEGRHRPCWPAGS